jgi:hypothetical protein
MKMISDRVHQHLFAYLPPTIKMSANRGLIVSMFLFIYLMLGMTENVRIVSNF